MNEWMEFKGRKERNCLRREKQMYEVQRKKKLFKEFKKRNSCLGNYKPPARQYLSFEI
jgi:hypothetical protein